MHNSHTRQRPQCSTTRESGAIQVRSQHTMMAWNTSTWMQHWAVSTRQRRSTNAKHTRRKTKRKRKTPSTRGARPRERRRNVGTRGGQGRTVHMHPVMTPGAGPVRPVRATIEQRFYVLLHYTKVKRPVEVSCLVAASVPAGRHRSRMGVRYHYIAAWHLAGVTGKSVVCPLWLHGSGWCWKIFGAHHWLLLRTAWSPLFTTHPHTKCPRRTP